MNSNNWFTFALVAARLAALIGVFAQVHLPFVTWRMRLAAAVGLGACLAPTQDAVFAKDADVLQFGILALREVLIGAILGLLSALLIVGLQWAGRWIARLSDLDVDETSADGEPIGPIAQLYALLAGAVFFGLGGHRLVIGAFLDSLDAVPIGAAEWPALNLTLAGAFAIQAFGLALRVAAPVLAALALANVAVALVQRLLPHVPAVALAAPLKSVVTILFVAASLSLVPMIANESWPLWSQRIAHVFSR